jgi:SAM-dependent methyltransferase
MHNSTIRSLHTSKHGKVSDKWESYLDFYDESLAYMRDQDISLLEIGVQNGGSLETWAEYFHAGKVFVGCDIDPNCGALRYEDPRIKVIVGDINTQEAFGKVAAASSSFDLIIDDGSHQSMDILNTFINYFPLVKPGGLFVIEDSHCLYLDSFGGGIMNEYSAQSFFKKLADVVSYQWWENDVSIRTYFQSFFAKSEPPAFMVEGWVDSISFRNSIITIRKAKRSGHDKLGSRIISGSDAIVQNWGGARPA